ncbi:hypothetical protein, partial [Corynebacterium sp. HMSC11D10]|uniref:hypothetical protein n=1 Tax=Corynebacterium sp. HMSC11D10 TaxID=1581088 RepID=UPI001AEFB07F
VSPSTGIMTPQRDGCSLSGNNFSGVVTPWPIRQHDVPHRILGFGFRNEELLGFVELVYRKREEIYGNNV